MGTSASFARKALLCLAAALLAFTLVPAGALAGEDIAEPSGTEGSEGAFGSEAPASPQSLSNPSTEAGSAVSDGTSAEAGTLAASLMGRPASFVNADVALDGEPVIGSFTLDGLTFAVTEGSNVELVGVSGPEVAGSTRATSEAEAEGSASEAAASIVALPESVAYNGVEYSVASIGAYAFYLSGVTSVELPASVIDVDERAFRSSDVASVTVAEGNPNYSSFDGALYSADRSSLLLIPEGKQGAVLLPKETEVAEAGKFSHCSLVDAISVEDGAAFASENGLLYDASLTTLLRVPASATEIAIREGCTTIAAGAMEGCASLATINAPASVASISPDIFTSVPTVSLPALVATDDADDSAQAEEGKDAGEDGDEAAYSVSTQLTALVALSSVNDATFSTNPTAINVVLLAGGDRAEWERVGFGKIEGGEDSAEQQLAAEDAAEQLPSAAMINETILLEEEAAAPVASTQSGSIYAAYTSMIYSLTVNDASMGSLVTTSEHLISGSVLGARESLSIGSSPGIYTMTLGSASYKLGRDDGYYVSGYPSPSAGYEFKGWAATATGSPQATMNVSHAASAGTGTLSVARYAIFAKKASVAVTLNANGGSGGTGTIYYWPDKGYTTSSASTAVITSVPSRPTRAGYTFAGYYSAANGGTQYVNANGALTSNAPSLSSTTTWYAHWTKNAISTVNLYQNAGNTTTLYKTVYLWYGKGWYSTSSPTDSSTALTTIGTPTRAGYTYKGFSTNSTATTGSYWTSVTTFPSNTSSTFGSATTAKTTRLYAVWTKNAISTVNLYQNAGNTTTLYKTVYLWYGKGWYSTSSPTDSSTKLTTIGTPTRAGYTYKGFSTNSTATTGSYWTSVTTFPSNTSSTFGSATTAKTTRLYAVWAGNTITCTWDTQGGSAIANTSATYSTTAKVPIPSSNPEKAGYAFAGWWTSASSGTQVTNSTALPTTNPTYYAHWTANSYDMRFDPHGGNGGQSGTVHMTFLETLPAIDETPPTRAGYSFDGWFLYNPDDQTYVNPVYDDACKPLHSSWPWGALALNADGSPKLEIHAKWTIISYDISYELNGGSVPGNPTSYDAETAAFTLNNPARTGYVFVGWSGTDLSGNANTTVRIEQGSTGDRTYEAHWIPALTVDMPIEVTAIVDMLGVEEQVEASSYIESRSGGSLAVAAIDFEPLAGASDLFGADNLSNVLLEAFVGSSDAADVSFALNAARTEEDANRLASFVLPGGYGSRIDVAYRFSIPEDVLASIDQDRFSDATTPIGQVVYTVKLA